MAARRPDGNSSSADLFLSYRKDGAWTKATNLSGEINTPAEEYSPVISPDGKYFFFTSARGRRPPEKQMNYEELIGWLRGTRNGLGDIYQMDFSALNISRQ
jgi:Tol biopolymer transport system component